MRGKYPTKADACCNGEKLFFMDRWISVVPAEDVQVEINHFIKLFGVKIRKEGIVEAVQASGYVIIGHARYNLVFSIKEEIEKFSLTCKEDREERVLYLKSQNEVCRHSKPFSGHSFTICFAASKPL